MKRIYIPILCTVAVCCSLVSCNPEGLEPDKYGDTPAEEDVFWNVVGQLVDSKNITPDYKGKTFKATIGSPDGGDESVRIVSVNDLGAAVSRFNILTGESITETTPFKDWRNNAVGRLTWTLSNDNTCWATVDVSIPAVPGLHKIIYRSPEQGDTNGSVGDDGSAYYRFGDVIKRFRQEDGALEYWVCVRPAFGPEGKAKSHWVSVSPLPMSHIWPYNSSRSDQKGRPFTASNGMEYGLPTLIGDDVEWHQDLAELLFAIMYPHEWQTNAINNYSTNMFGVINGLRIFNDFSKDNIKYHNEEFWKKVQSGWRSKDIVQTVFGVTYDEMAAALNPNNANAQGLHLLYNGYSWNTTTSNKPKLYQLHYTSGEGDKEKNMHKQTKTTVSAQVVTPRNQVESNTNFPLDVFNLYLNRPYLSETRFFGDAAPRWIVRYATGEDLSSNGHYDPQQPISGFTGADEVYRYYKDVYQDKNLTDEPEITDDGYVGKSHYRWGNVYRDENQDKWFVINPSGFDYDDPTCHEHSLYTELISFDHAGIQVSADHMKATNLPSLEEAYRMIPFLFRLANQSMNYQSDQHAELIEGDGLTYLNIKNYGGIELKKIMQAIKAQDNDPRNASIACCIAYDNGQGSMFQPLMRLVVNCQNAKRDPHYYCWTKYPSAPNTQTQFVQNFSNVDIMLQDIADKTMVTRYAPDTYAVQPLSKLYWPQSDDTQQRSIRNSVDDRALDIRNYFYDRDAFENMTSPGSMWNEPVLVIRYTRVRDLGDSNYSPTTVDGHTLTLVHERPWDDYDYYEIVDNLSTVWMSIGEQYLNGQKRSLKTWRELQ